MHVYNLHDTHRVIRIMFVVYMYRQIVCMCAKAAAAEFKFKLFKFLHRHDFTEYHDLAPEDGWAPHDNGQNNLFLLPTTPHNSDNSI